jgi:2-oxoglutarate dehydrogenase E1 component
MAEFSSSMKTFSVLGHSEISQVEAMYAAYQADPGSVEASWKDFFLGFDFARAHFDTGGTPGIVGKEFNVINLINGYRSRGHLFTHTNPVRARRTYSPTLDIGNFGLEEADLDTVFHAGHLIGIGDATLRNIVAHLQDTYCRSIGAEYKYIRTPEIAEWLERKMEGCRNSKNFTLEEKRRMLRKLNEAVAFEHFIHHRFAGQKRFSLEGSESLIPAFDAVINTGAASGIREFVIGMAHRGRLNVLANILGKSSEDIFTEFEGLEFEELNFAGDVKYHLGFSSYVTAAGGQKVHLSVAPNPSHLEAVDAVVQGMVRAKIDQTEGGHEGLIAPILIHGDAAIAGQGVVYEVLQMSQLNGYRTGGTVHLVINNQVGFTTNYLDGRSSTYCTDVAKVTLSPVFHVNADDVEALVYTVELALEFRQKFRRDVFIDILGYRKYGHNEGDEPRFTQPLLYKAIATHPDAREIYSKKLSEQGELEGGLVKEMEAEYKQLLERSLDTARKSRHMRVSAVHEGPWNALRPSTPGDFEETTDTGMSREKLAHLGQAVTRLPPGKKFFSKTIRLFDERRSMLKEDRLDWAMTEQLAFASLLSEGFPVRFSGQDVERGTFSQRHAVLRVEDSEEQYTPLNHLGKGQAPLYMYNSPLSEYGVMGFEYGYSLSAPNSLVVWEAQFGDFMNGAQIIIDQYLSSAEDKWKRMSGLVLLLPHGFEGQGAEHSSARIERFLNLCGEDNMQVVNCSTPANYFHALRRQLKRPFRKPLVVFTPKSLLRHPRVTATLEALASGHFEETMDDAAAVPGQVTRVVLCSGKFYYDLLAEHEKQKDPRIALIRLEQLYPLPRKQLYALRKKYGTAQWLWAQEEPENMGGVSYLMRSLGNWNIRFAARPESASPATGSHQAHEAEQKRLLENVLNPSFH